MDKDTMVLKDGTVMELETGASLGSIGVVSSSRAAMAEKWDKLTETNLSEVQIKNGAGLTVGRYTDLVLVSETSAVQEDGTVRTSFCLREKDRMEKRMDAMEESQTVQDAGISDLGQAVSDIMGGVQ